MPKAQQDETFLAFQMNNKNIPQTHRYSFNLVAENWVNKISIRDKTHDGTKMTGTAYLVPYNVVAQVDKVKDEDLCIIKSLIKYPEIDATLKKGKELNIRGDTWA